VHHNLPGGFEAKDAPTALAAARFRRLIPALVSAHRAKCRTPVKAVEKHPEIHTPKNKLLNYNEINEAL
jgi:hypothetical protein